MLEGQCSGLGEALGEHHSSHIRQGTEEGCGCPGQIFSRKPADHRRGKHYLCKSELQQIKAIFRDKHHNNHRFLLKHWCCLSQMAKWPGDLPRKEGDVCSRSSLIQETGNFSFCSHLSALTTRLRLFWKKAPH